MKVLKMQFMLKKKEYAIKRMTHKEKCALRMIY